MRQMVLESCLPSSLPEIVFQIHVFLQFFAVLLLLWLAVSVRMYCRHSLSLKHLSPSIFFSLSISLTPMYPYHYYNNISSMSSFRYICLCVTFFDKEDLFFLCLCRPLSIVVDFHCVLSLRIWTTIVHILYFTRPQHDLGYQLISVICKKKPSVLCILIILNAKS